MAIEHNEKFLEQLKRHEGLRLEAYLCPAKKLTIGWGHNLEAHPMPGIEKVGDRITKPVAMKLFETDVCLATSLLDKRLPWWRELDMPRQAVLANMCFQMGIGGLCGFAKMLAAVELKNWLRAGAEMLKSKWAEEDAPARAAELARQMQTGEWQ